ncbi:succinylglutamate desuccinylase/aspartoacylase family protein, partial [Vibrio sp. 10N.222.49.E5]
THSPLSIPIEIIHGRQAGPTLMVNAAIHGDELNGVEIARQLTNAIEPNKLKGTLIVVPIVNVFGFIHKSRYLPDRRDLNRCFPGSEKGSLTSRIAYT